MNEAALAIRLAWALVHFLWQGVLLGLVAWVALTLLRRKRPEVRYAASCLFLLGGLVLPVVTLLVQGVPAGQVSPEVADTASYQVLMAFRSQFASWLPLLLVLWGLGALVLGLRALGSWLWLRRLGGQAVEVLEARCLDLLEDLRRVLGIRARVRLLESSKVRGPFVHGLLNPVIFVPLGFLASMDPLALRAVLAHELAHIRRLDVLVIGLQTLIETLLYYHPVTWWLSRRVTTERECCCDAVAVQACGDPVLFARTLHRLDELQTDAVPALAGGNLMERIQRLLKRDPGPGRIPTPLFSGVLALSATLLLAQQPAVRELVRIPLDRLADAPHRAPMSQEVRGAVAAIQAPEETLYATPKPAQPLQDIVFAGGLTDTRVLQPAPVPTVPIPAARSAQRRSLPLTRLGVPFRTLYGTPIDSWPDGSSTVNGDRLPHRNLWLEDALGRSDEAGAYAFTTWPFTSKYARRLVQVRIPPRSQATFTVVGTSGTKRDAFFTLAFARFKTLVPEAWGTLLGNGTSLKVTHRGEESLQGVLVLNGPEATAYRCDQSFTSVQEGAPEATMDLDAWPEGEVYDARSEGSSTRGLVALLQDWRAVRPTDGGQSHAGGALGPLPDRNRAELKPHRLGSLHCVQMEMAPGESFRFRVDQEAKVQMETVTLDDEADPAWKHAVQTANATDAVRRRTLVEVQNPTAKPQSLVLVLYQLEEDARPFRVKRERLVR